MCETIQLKGTVLKIDKPTVNEKTGFVKKTIHFKPHTGKVFFPEFHYQKIRMLDNILEGDEVVLGIKIWGSGSEKINNVVADGIIKLN